MPKQRISVNPPNTGENEAVLIRYWMQGGPWEKREEISREGKENVIEYVTWKQSVNDLEKYQTSQGGKEVGRKAVQERNEWEQCI